MKPHIPINNGQSRAGSALILIAAFLVVMAVLSFGFLSYVMDQRGAARNAQIQGLLHHALTSGRDHAKFFLDHQATETTAGTGLDGPWVTAFASTPGYPDAVSEPDPNARRTLRLALAGARNPGEWGDLNAVNLFGNTPGLSSPPDQTDWNGHDRGNTVHDGTAKWLPLGYFDRSLRRTTDAARAAYRLRYAVAIIDQQGLIAFNKQRYEHLMAQGIPHIEEPRRSLGSWYRGERTVPVPGTGVQYNDVTDPSSGSDSPTQGFRAVRYNSFRPIPADHSLLAGALYYHGFDIEDVQLNPKPLQDGIEGGRISLLADLMNVAVSDGSEFIYAQRILGDLPDSYRKMGYYKYTNLVIPIRDRYLDHLPFEWSSTPLTTAVSPAYRATGQNYSRGWILSATAPVGTIMELANANQLFLDNPLTVDPWLGSLRPSSTEARNNTNINRELRRLSLEQIRNRHPAHLVTMLNGFFNDSSNAVVGFGPTGSGSAIAPVVEGLAWVGADVVNWEGVRQQLRIDGTVIQSWDAARGWTGNNKSQEGDDIVQSFTPFSTSSGQFRTVVGTDRLTQKNMLEMSTQFPINIRTAPPRVIDAVLRLVLSEVPDPTTLTWVSRDGSDATKAIYDRSIAHIRRGIIAWRSTATLLSANVSPAEWIAAIPPAADITNLAGFKNALLNQPGFEPDNNTTSTAKLSLASLVYGGPSLRGPAAHFRVHSLSFANGQPASSATQAILVLEGRHVSRLIGDRQSAPDFEPHIWLRLTAATAGLATRIPEYDARTGLRGVTSANGLDRRITSAPGAPPRPFEISLKDPTSSEPDPVLFGGSGRTTVLIDLRPSGINTVGRHPYMGGYGTAADLEPLVSELSVPPSRPDLVRCVAYHDYATQRWRENLSDPLEWLSNGPGLTFTNSVSRHFRIAVRARLESLDNTTDAWERTWQVVYRADPDLSGYAAGTTGTHDGDILYQDEDNPGRLRGVNSDGTAVQNYPYLFTE